MKAAELAKLVGRSRSRIAEIAAQIPGHRTTRGGHHYFIRCPPLDAWIEDQQARRQRGRMRKDRDSLAQQKCSLPPRALPVAPVDDHQLNPVFRLSAEAPVVDGVAAAWERAKQEAVAAASAWIHGGRLLLEQRAQVGAGHWIEWLATNCPCISPITAGWQMRAARYYQQHGYLTFGMVRQMYLAAGIMLI